MKDEVLSV